MLDHINELMLAPALFELARNGKKTVTIRSRHRDLRLGQMFLRNVQSPATAIQVRAWRVTHTTLGRVSEEALRADGFTDSMHALEGLRRFYGDMCLDSDVTVVEWA
jgi:hypothetical protein